MGNTFEMGKCPSCSHDQHVGKHCPEVVGVRQEMDKESVLGTLVFDVPTYCACPPLKAIKADTGKQEDFDLFAWECIPYITQIYQYGISKGYLKASWRKVPPEKYRDAMVRHFLAVMEEGPWAPDAESGKPHVWHLAWNVITYGLLTKK